MVINKYASLSRQELIKKIAFIHHRITQIHPFPDGNGRTSRAFMNILLLHIGLLPIFVEIEGKSIYYSALEFADKGNLEYLEQYIMKEQIRSHIELYSNKGI
ncbi:MAG: Fic family protein [Lachnospiraceae bacterium]|nr:Fic family protein [Lachnospiraceae bacterium]